MRAMVVVEGPNESRGAVENLLRALGGQSLDCTYFPVSSPELHVVHGKGDRYYKRMMAWIGKAERDGFDAIVLLIDHDGDNSRIQQAADAQGNQDSTFKRAIGVAVQAFEAWLLADQRALSAALGATVDQQPDPESIREPKRHLHSLIRVNTQLLSRQRHVCGNCRRRRRQRA